MSTVQPVLKQKASRKKVSSPEGTLTILADVDLQHRRAAKPSRSSARRAPASPRCWRCSPGSTSRAPGAVWLNGAELTALDEDGRAAVRARQVGFVFQTFHLVPSLTALENVMLPLELAGQPNARGAAREVLARRPRRRAASTIRGSCRAASSSASRSRARSYAARRCCSPTSRPAISTPRPASASSTCCSS